MIEPSDIAAGAACVAALSAVWSAYNGRRTLKYADADRVERSRPVVAAEFRVNRYAERVLSLYVKNYGQTVARNVRVAFVPEITPEEGKVVGNRATLVQKFDKPISVMAPGAELDSIYFFPRTVDGEIVNAEDLPDQLRVTISYDGPKVRRRFRPDFIERYEDSFDLDTTQVRARTTVSSSTEPSARMKEIAKEIAKAARAIGQSRDSM